MAPPPKEERLLIVDDTPQNLQVLGTILRQQGYKLSVAQHGRQALEVAAKAPPDLILLDVMMPEMDGFEACRRLKEDPRTRDIPIIFLTAKTAAEDIVQGFEAGGVDYVAKPFNPAELLKRVQTHLELKAARERIQGLATKLSHYLPPPVYASLFAGERDARIESRRRFLTVFFADIVKFTPRSERMKPGELTDWLNRYLDEMALICAGHGGTLDKFMGDGIMGFFGDPQTQGEQEDALACVRMALAMQQRAGELEVPIRIGIASGECTVGNFGSEAQMSYTIIGRLVNLAARLETNSEPGRILLSESTQALVSGAVACQPRGPIMVKGIDHEINTFWVEGRRS
jgi:class 3 adenylate cyclase/CheY-like chemotaxis protein